tara:strand:+ start:49820 stop:50371 length:552 start_codon:yes stop_codon:yes gene_type:complete
MDNIKEKLINEISQTMFLGLEKESGINDVDDYDIDENGNLTQCVKLLDSYTTNITTRLRADFENEKKRNEKKEKIVQDQIKFETLSKFTEILDDLQFFKDVVKDSRSEYVKSGFILFNRKVKKFLKESKIEVVNTKVLFNPELHECVSLMDGNKKKGTILKVASRGYKIGDRIIKYPKVIVQS